MNEASTPTAQRSFAALRHPGYRGFFFSFAGAMMADSIEHVISYWVIFQKFHSPALGGFAVVSHWVPFLLFSVYVGALADRYDPRRLIQLGMLLFMGVSIAWGVLFATDTLQMWHAMALLIMHGVAGVLWVAPAQVLLHDLVSAEQLQSAVRLNATSRQLGLLMGPALGGGILLLMGPTNGIFFNALLYVPTIVWLSKAPFKRRTPIAAATRSGTIHHFLDIAATFRAIANNRSLVAMILLAGGAALFIGNAYQAQMPGFANDLGFGDADLAYSMLLGADAAGALTAGFVLESRGLLQANPRTAFALAMLWCCALAGFALSQFYVLALVLLFAAGFVELSFNSMAQTLVQLHAPSSIRGRVLGLYSMVALGSRAFSGITVGLIGSIVGIHAALAGSAMTLLALCSLLFVFGGRRRS